MADRKRVYCCLAHMNESYLEQKIANFRQTHPALLHNITYLRS